MKKVITLLAILCVAAMLLAGCQNTPAEHTHTLIHNEEKAPTCVNNGILEHWYCPACNARFADEAATQEVTFADLEVEELGHTGGTATCTEQAICERCEKPYGDPLGHTGGTATCTEQAVCERCSQPYGSALGHTAGDAATCTTAQVCTVCNAELAPAAGHTPGADATCTADQVCTVCDEVLVAAKGHADANSDYKCDNCSTKMLPADGTALTIPQAIAVAKVAGSGYSTQKYYITGIVTGLYNTTYGNMYIKDADGNQICIYGLYSFDGKTRYDAMSYKPVNGDEITVYTVLGTYNSTAQGKNAWMDEVVMHEHDYKAVVTEPGCLTEGYTTHTCSICQASYVDSKVAALGHTTEEGVCDNCGLTIGGDAPVVGTLAEFTFGANGSAAHVDGNDLGASKSYTVGSYTLALKSMSKVFGPAYDAKGNSCIKLGTSKVVGSFSFTVPENVTEVVIYVAGYKAATSTNVKVNGTQTNVKTTSNNGEYTAITIDTTTTKTITFTSVTYRCMIDKIVFNGTAN